MCILVWDGLVGAYTWLCFHLLWVACVYGNGSIGCTNNNYASREKCNKCRQPKEVAATPAIAMPGASLPTCLPYFARAPVGPEQKINIGLTANAVLHHPLPWPTGGTQISRPPYANPTNHPLSVLKGWRNGDWMCNSGFHIYSSRAQCKNCNASIPPALGTKRLASEELSQDWENMRLNSGNNMQVSGLQQTYAGIDQIVGATADLRPGMFTPYTGVSSGVSPIWQAPVHLPHQVATPALLGKGAKQWRTGDWMCTNGNNHNYASRPQCNRCKTQRNAVAQQVSQEVNAV